MDTADTVNDPGEEALREGWAFAFAAQSLSDYCIFLRLRFLRQTARTAAPEVCHELHSLQMACEKIAKAYRIRHTGVGLRNEMSGHVAFSQFIELYLSLADYRQHKRYQGNPRLLTDFNKRTQRIAGEIENLAPAVDRAGTPPNAEYPWHDGQEVRVPCRYSYPSLHLLTSPKEIEGIKFLQVVRIAIEEFNGKRIIQDEQGEIRLEDDR